MPEVTTELERDPVYVVRTAAFDGPIELLLTLAQRAEVDLKTIALASLNDDYLRAIDQERPPLDRLPAADQVTFELEHVSLADKLDHLRQMLAHQPQLNFSAVFHHARTRLEAVVTFLALLELIRIGEARVAQPSAFAEITVHAQERKEN